MSRIGPSRSKALTPSGCCGVSAARAFTFCLAVLLLLAAPQSSAEVAPHPPEPSSYRMDNYREPTPATLRGARVIDTDEARRMWLDKSAVFIDATPRPPKPANIPAGTIWRDQPRINIPGSAWLVDVGYGAISRERDAYFRSWLQKLTGGDKGRAIVFYCKAACWMSWNAAKRAIEEYGYANVLWYPEGTDGWQAQSLALEEDQPEPVLPGARSDATVTPSR